MRERERERERERGRERERERDLGLKSSIECSVGDINSPAIHNSSGPYGLTQPHEGWSCNTRKEGRKWKFDGQR
jgi:hypothetical protein